MTNVTNKELALMTHTGMVQKYEDWQKYVKQFFEPVQQRLEAEKRCWRNVVIIKGIPVEDKIRFVFRYSNWGMDDSDQDRDPNAWVDVADLMDMDAYQEETARLLAEREAEDEARRIENAAAFRASRFKQYQELKAIFEPEE